MVPFFARRQELENAERMNRGTGVQQETGGDETMERRERVLKQWMFARGETQPAANAWEEVTVPHDWCAAETVTQSAALGMAQGFFPRGGIGWYACEVSVADRQPDRRYVLDFDGVFECSTVWVNGIEAGGQRYGYTPFALDVTEAIRAGHNRILVRVDNTRQPADRWYSGCGIYRPVRFWEMDAVCLNPEKVCITADVTDACAGIRIQTGCAEPVQARLFDAAHQLVAETEGTEELTLTLTSPHRWSADDPYLYTLRLSLASGDAIEMRTGLRDVRFDRDRGLLINGESVTLRGVCLHQDLGALGIAQSPEMWRDRLWQLKKLGVNALRLAHHVYSREMLDLCDEMGFYVYSECFDKWHSGLYGRYFDEDWAHDLSAMILRNRNRPCILIWGVGNEVENQGQMSMLETLRMLTDKARALDPTRPVTYAMNPHFKREGRKIDFSKVMDIQKIVDEADEQEIEDADERVERICGIAQYVDILSCNYQEQWFDRIHRRIPDKLILTTEAYPFFVGHTDSMQNYTQQIPALIPEKAPYTIGSFIWTGYDYLGESMDWPSKGWTGSLLRLDNTMRCAAYILRGQWVREPMVHISVLDNVLGDELTKGHWACPPYEDVWDFPQLHQGVVPYLIATNCERVEIHVAGRVFHPDMRGLRDGYMQGFIPWLPGTLEVWGFMGEKRVCTHALVTPGPAAALTLSSAGSRRVLPGERQLLTAEVTDRDGHPCIRSVAPVTFTAKGDVRIVATQSANLMDHTPFTAHTLPAWHGKASVIIERTGSGSAEVRASSAGMADGVYVLADRA